MNKYTCKYLNVHVCVFIYTCKYSQYTHYINKILDFHFFSPTNFYANLKSSSYTHTEEEKYFDIFLKLYL